MSEHIVENNPKREFLFALGGVGLFLGIVLLIGISGFLRPAGEHITAETTEAAAVAETDATNEKADTAETAAAPVAETDAAATATPADGTVVAAESGTATAEGTVNQAAVADDADLTATPADADLDAGKTGEITHTWKAEE